MLGPPLSAASFGFSGAAIDDTDDPAVVDAFAIDGPFDAAAPATRQPAADFRLPARSRSRRGGVRAGDPLDAGASRLSPAGHRRRRQTLLIEFYRERPRHGELRRGHRAARSQRLLVSPEFLFRVERTRPGGHAGRHLPPQRPRAGVAAVVLPVEQHPGRRAARPGRARAGSASRPCSSSRCGACWPTTRSSALVAQLRRPVAVAAQPAARVAGPERVPRVRRQPARGVPARDRAVPREPAARGPQRRSSC